MAQRVMIAMALACEPELLIADEPTTALDVTIQAQILDLMRNLRDETGTAIILITHDLGVVAEMCDRVAVMYAGEIVEQTDVTTLFREPLHPYTRGLIGVDPGRRRGPGRAGGHPGQRAQPDRPAAGLPVRAALPGRGSRRTSRSRPRSIPSCCRLGPGHDVRCWLYHDAARRADAPAGAGRAAAAAAGVDEPRDGAAERPAHDRARVDRPSRGRDARRPAPARPTRTPLVEVRDLVKHFPIRGGILQRTDRPWSRPSTASSFEIRRGETLGLVGESGCGKTTVGRLLLRLIEPTVGHDHVRRRRHHERSRARALKPYRRRMQIIFQDPYASLDPRTPIGDSIGEGLRIHGLGTSAERRAKVRRMMDMVGLQPYHARRYPHEFSGGQRQRIGIARALVLEPDLVVCDEPVSALDVSIQAQVLNLLKTLQRELGLTYVFVAHNMGVVEHISDRVAVMYLGRIAELADRRDAVPARRSTRTPWR